MASSPRTTSTAVRHACSVALVITGALAVLALLVASRYVVNTMWAHDVVGGSTTPSTMGARMLVDTTVERVVDGDTLVAEVEGRAERVRLIGVDTPETVSPSKPVQCYGRQASDHLKALLAPGTAVTLVTDAETHDQYGRLLAYVYRHADGLFVNLELARDGYASLLTYPPNVAHESQFAQAVDAAHQRRLGLWGTCGGRVCRSPTPPRPPPPPPPGNALRAGSVSWVTTLAQRLGFTADDRVLVINCDDLGMCHAANAGVYESLRTGVATSATLMVPCPWAREASARYLGEDVGVHLTLNSEWDLYRWGPITQAPSLLDGDGGFPRTTTDVWDHADLDEVRRECRAQIERAILWGFDVSHLDSHMGRCNCGRSSSTSTWSWPSTSACRCGCPGRRASG